VVLAATAWRTVVPLLRAPALGAATGGSGDRA
jgi:hypothetical protein